METIDQIAAKLDIPADRLQMYGRSMAKVELAALEGAPADHDPKLILVSAITPTPAGEGKTTTTIGLGDALARRGLRTCIALREPSLGPCFGIKGGGTGGGRAQLVPSERVNLHFTGDFHAITSAHNLIAATLDNHLHFGSDLNIDPRRVRWPRVMDMNDRALRRVVTGLSGPTSGMPRETCFDITAASELMAILCLSTDLADLRERVDRILIGFTRQREPVYAGQLGCNGAVVALLRDAINPNLVQTQDGTPAFVHGGPFANIAHGCNSVIATRMALRYADWVVTEAGFGFDLGAEKFFDIKCRGAGLDTAAVVLVATARALKMHGGKQVKELGTEDLDALARGLENLDKHIESIQTFGETPVVAVNRFDSDSDAEIAAIRAHCEKLGVACAPATHFADGGAGAEKLAAAVVENAGRSGSPFKPTYELSDSIPDKIRAVAQKIYGARDISLTTVAERRLAEIQKLGFAELPVCIAKTQSSLSDNPKLPGRPRDFEITVRDLQINAGAGFIVALTGDILRMPGLPRKPQAEAIDVIDGEIVGLR